MMKLHLKIIILTLAILALPSFAYAAASKHKKADKQVFTVVIDAGHGGKDTGAVDNNVKEKDINLGVATQLATLIKKNLKDVKVVMTRDNDTFISLQERAERANNAKGNLFISIHTNSVDKSNKNRKTVAGASVYVLGLHKDQNNMNVARRENSVIEFEKNYEQRYSGFDPSKDESYIIFEMAQKKNLSQSIKFAEETQRELAKTAGRRDRGVHQAGFWVLWATSMPSVLVELDFICNPNSAKYMASATGQKKLAESIFNAVKTYSASYLNAKKNGMNVAYAGEDSENIDQDSSEIGEKVIASSGHKKEVTPAPSSNQQKNTSGKRRRRSASAKEASDNRNLESNNIQVSTSRHMNVEAVAMNGIAQDSPQEKEDNAKANNKKGKKKNKKKKERKNNEGDLKVKAAFAAATKQSDPTSAASRRSTHASRRKKKDVEMKTVYKIQLLASTDELKTNNPRFCGLKPISSFRENNLYKYTYGESENKNEMETLLKKVKDMIPDAFIIKITKLDDVASKK